MTYFEFAFVSPAKAQRMHWLETVATWDRCLVILLTLEQFQFSGHQNNLNRKNRGSTSILFGGHFDCRWHRRHCCNDACQPRDIAEAHDLVTMYHLQSHS